MSSAPKNTIKIAKNHNKKCVVCSRKKDGKQKLYSISKKSIANAFVKHRIIIPEGSRTCSRHLDLHNELEEDAYEEIPIKFQKFNGNLIRFLDCIKKSTEDCFEREKQLEKKFSVFDPFKHPNKLNNEHCIKITGWSKDTFFRFCRLITRVRTSKNRNLYMLVSLYRYWLRKVNKSNLKYYLQYSQS